MYKALNLRAGGVNPAPALGDEKLLVVAPQWKRSQGQEAEVQEEEKHDPEAALDARRRRVEAREVVKHEPECERRHHLGCG